MLTCECERAKCKSRNQGPGSAMDAWQWERSYAWARVFYVPPALDAGTQYSGPGRNCESESHTHRFPHRPESATQARTYALNFSSTSSLSAAERERRQQGSTRCVWLKLACNSSIHGHSQGHSQWRARAGRKPVGTAALNGQCTRGANTPSDHVRNGQQGKRGRQDKKKRADRPKARQTNKGTYDRLRERYHERASASRMDTM